ncbi:MAG: hypothetical protein ACRDLA_11385 [Thermoleophilaceae bacterium]
MTSATPARRSPVAERVLSRSVAKGMATAIPLMVAFLVALVVVALGSQHPDWSSWLGMAVGVGVLAGVFFGTWAGFVASAHEFDEADVPARRRVADSRHPPANRSNHP